MGPMTLPPGFRFHPTDEELVSYYLYRKINGGTIDLEVVPEVDLYKCEPWDLPDKSILPSKDMEWYFYSPRDRKYPNGSRTNRATRSGYWKATGKDRAVHSQKRPVGMKKTLVYYKGRAPHGVRTDWVMHEYRLIDSASAVAGSPLKDCYALCRVFKKNIGMPNTKQSLGAVGDQVLWDDNNDVTPETSRDHRDDAEDGNINRNPSEASSSDLTQGTPMAMGSKVAPDEVNSCINQLQPYTAENLSNLPQDYTSLICETWYPPLGLEDFPQIDLTVAKSSTECMIRDSFRECVNGIEEIYSVCSTQENMLNHQNYAGSN